MNNLAVVAGALRYEFRMQLRRPAVWVVLGLISVIIFALWWGFASDYLWGFRSHEGQGAWVPPSQHDPVLFWAQLLAMFLPVGVGLVLADRLARDHSTRVDEVFAALPAPLGARLLGKYLGSVLATLVPVALIYSAMLVYIMTQTPGTEAITLGTAAFLAVLLPAILFVAGFSLAAPAVLKVPVYQFLFVGYWFWANLMSPKIGLPSPVATMLNAAGPWAQEGL